MPEKPLLCAVKRVDGSITELILLLHSDRSLMVENDIFHLFS